MIERGILDELDVLERDGKEARTGRYHGGKGEDAQGGKDLRSMTKQSELLYTWIKCGERQLTSLEAISQVT
mgnify:CR=1 FL=1